MKDYIISLDVGKHETKSIGRRVIGSEEDIKRVHFRTKMYNLKDGYIDLEGNSHKVLYNDKEIIIGDQGETKSYETSKTNELHLISAYTAITQFLEPNSKNNKIYLALACPLSVLKIEEAKEEYKNFIKGNGTIDIEVDDNKYSFEIEDIVIKAEGSGLVYTEPDLFKDKTVLITDFGGLNMGLALYKNKVCSPSNRYPEELGSDELTNITRAELIRCKKGNIVSIEQTETAIDLGYMTKNSKPIPETIEAVKISKEKFFDKALKIIESHSIHIDELDKPVFVGGTTEKIKEIILKKIPNAYVVPNAQWTTVEGLYKVVFAKYMKVKKEG
ncbi:recombinase [Clostridium sp.]|uniref:ParM/StbA family protein n=1 Tax=Clostridium sp. TaxID=1506 RepID=UPI0035A0A497